jgi:hypothetical protein
MRGEARVILFVGCAAIAVAVGTAGAKLVDTFGSKLGLYRPMPHSDPAHVQLRVLSRPRVENKNLISAAVASTKPKPRQHGPR